MWELAKENNLDNDKSGHMMASPSNGGVDGDDEGDDEGDEDDGDGDEEESYRVYCDPI